MGVKINGMDMPSSCYDCPLCYDGLECLECIVAEPIVVSMGVKINGMDMPSSCYDCPLCYDGLECIVAEPIIDFCGDTLKEFDFCTERHPRCPLSCEDRS